MRGANVWEGQNATLSVILTQSIGAGRMYETIFIAHEYRLVMLVVTRNSVTVRGGEI